MSIRTTRRGDSRRSAATDIQRGRAFAEALERRQLLSTGAVVSGFGQAGQFNYSSDDGFDAAAFQSDGKAVLIGGQNVAGPLNDFSVLRITSAGTLDPTFGTGGVVSTDILGSADFANSVEIQADGKIVVAGTTHIGYPSSNVQHIAVVRYNSDGSLDSTFGTGGISYLSNATYSAAASLAIGSDGTIVVGGYTQDDTLGDNYTGAVAVFNADGSIRNSFGTNGFETLNLGTNAAVSGIGIDSSGRIYAEGAYDYSTLKIIRLLNDGTIDTSYGSSGLAQSSAVGVEPGNMLLLSDGSVIAAGFTFNTSPQGESLFKFTPSGQVDTSFGTNGVASVTGMDLSNLKLALAPNGTIYLSGEVFTAAAVGTNTFQYVDFGMAAFNADGSTDLNFGFDGHFAYDAVQHNSNAFNVAISPSGQILQMGEAGASTAVAILIDPTLPLSVTGTPVPYPGGNYSVNEGSSIELTSYSRDFTSSITQYQWDYNYNASSGAFNVDGTTAQPTFSAFSLDGPSTVTVGLRIVDAAGVTSTIATTKVTINNVAPTASITRNFAVAPGGTAYIGLSNPFDPSEADAAAGFTYSYDFNDDGTFDITNTTVSLEQIPTTDLMTPGVHTARVRISDKDGGYTDYTNTITVSGQTTGSIVGQVFDDLNVNGQYDSYDRLLAGQTVYVDENSDGLLDNNEPSAVTNSNGSFTITGLSPGTYAVRLFHDSAGRYVQTLPANSGAISVVVTAGQALTSPLFGVHDTTFFATFNGTVYSDTNGNGKLDSGEGTIAGATVYIDTNNNGQLDPGELSTTTSASGTYPVGI